MKCKAVSKRQRRTEPGQQEKSSKLDGEQNREGWGLLRELPWELNSEPSGLALLPSPSQGQVLVFGPCI